MTKDLADELERLAKEATARPSPSYERQRAMNAIADRVLSDYPLILSALRGERQGIETMERALIAAIERFEEYADLHAAKPDMEKARRNSDMADMLRAALPPPPKGTSHE